MDIGIIKTTAKKYPAGTISTILLVLVVGLYAWRHSTFGDAQDALTRNSEQSQRYQNNISNSVQLEEQFHAIENANRIILGRLVNPQDLALNLEYFYKLERETGVKLVETRPASAFSNKPTAASKNGFKPVQYVLSLQGTYMKTLTFIRRLEQGSYYCRVVSASCNAAQEDSLDKDKNAVPEVMITLTVEILGKA